MKLVPCLCAFVSVSLASNHWFPWFRFARDPIMSVLSMTRDPSGPVWSAPPDLHLDRFLEDQIIEYEFHSEEDTLAFSTASEHLLADVWLQTPQLGRVRLSLGQQPHFDHMLPPRMQGSSHIFLENLHSSVLKTYPLDNVVLPASDFAKLDEIYRYTGGRAHRDVGNSWQGRPVRAVGSQDESGPLNVPQHSKLVICGLHGREWASVALCLHIAELQKRSGRFSNAVTVPVANPDGYEFTWSEDRLWTKSRQPTGLVMCAGHDLARHFLGDPDPGAVPCSETWTGGANEAPLESAYLSELAKAFETVVVVHGLSTGAEPEVVDRGKVKQVRLPEYGNGYIHSKRNLESLFKDVTNMIIDI